MAKDDANELLNELYMDVGELRGMIREHPTDKWNRDVERKVFRKTSDIKQKLMDLDDLV